MFTATTFHFLEQEFKQGVPLIVSTIILPRLADAPSTGSPFTIPCARCAAKLDNPKPEEP
jgi:hypothetical protein